MLSNVSIHAPARGATETAENCVVARKVSIHAPARGATGIGSSARTCDKVSIHAPARGATAIISGARRWRRFQSTRPRGARRCSCPHCRPPEAFQSTRPRGARLSVRNRLYFRLDTTNISTTLTLLPEKAVPHPEKEVFFVLLQHDRACADLPQKTAGLRSSHQKMSGPSGSYAALHPKCSILPLQLFPSR